MRIVLALFACSLALSARAASTGPAATAPELEAAARRGLEAAQDALAATTAGTILRYDLGRDLQSDQCVAETEALLDSPAFADAEASLEGSISSQFSDPGAILDVCDLDTESGSLACNFDFNELGADAVESACNEGS